ncbi:bacteriocin-like protein [Chryseobacterium piperi]
MKNIKKLTRHDLKIVQGGLAYEVNTNYCPGENTYCCRGLCRISTYQCG